MANAILPGQDVLFLKAICFDVTGAAAPSAEYEFRASGSELRFCLYGEPHHEPGHGTN